MMKNLEITNPESNRGDIPEQGRPRVRRQRLSQEEISRRIRARKLPQRILVGLILLAFPVIRYVSKSWVAEESPLVVSIREIAQEEKTLDERRMELAGLFESGTPGPELAPRLEKEVLEPWSGLLDGLEILRGVPLDQRDLHRGLVKYMQAKEQYLRAIHTFLLEPTPLTSESMLASGDRTEQAGKDYVEAARAVFGGAKPAMGAP